MIYESNETSAYDLGWQAAEKYKADQIITYCPVGINFNEWDKGVRDFWDKNDLQE
jgi:hypothetical protein